MANFVAYGQRLAARDISTLHVVGAYAAGGYALIHNSDITSMPFLSAQEESEGNFGWHSPDYVTGSFGTTGYAAKDGYFGYGLTELVGVQVYGLSFVEPSGQVQTLKSSQLANYVEKTEHRYLKNGHVMIKVYFIEDKCKQILGTRNQMIVHANALLQSGSDLRGNLFKKRVPFMLSLPCDLGDAAAVNGYQNPTIDVESFLYPTASSGAAETGTTVQVLNMGTSSGNSLNWNTVRTKTNFVGPTTAGQRMDLDVDATGSAAFYPHFGQLEVLTNLSGNEYHSVVARRPGVSRSNHDYHLPNSIFYGDIYAHTGSGDIFDIREMNAMMNQGFTANDTLKQSYGRTMGTMITGPEPNYTGYQGFTSGHYPAYWGLDSLITYTSATFAAVNGGMPHDVDGDPLGGLWDSHFNTQVSRRNPFFPEYGSQYSYYVNFYSWQYNGFSSNEYIPLDTSNSTLLNATDFPAYAAEQFRLALVGTIPGSAQSGINSSNGVAWLQATTTELVEENKLSWQDYVDNAFHCQSLPYTEGNSNVLAMFSVQDSDGNPMMTDEEIKFSGNLSSGTMTSLHTQSLTIGFPTARDAAEANQYETEDTVPTGGQVKDLDTGVLFKYSVFVYADNPQIRASKETLDGPFIDNAIDGKTDPNGNTYSLDFIQSANAELNHGVTYELDITAATGDMTNRQGPLIFDWASSSITTNKCADRNALSPYYDTDGELQFKIANCNECVDADYNRCGCNSQVEDYAPGELVNLHTLEADSRRFETVITCPRAITTNFTDAISGGPDSTFTSILYVNSYFSTIDVTSDIDNTYSSAYLVSDTPADNKYVTGSGGNTYTHRLIDDLNLADYSGPIYNDAFNNKRTDTNTFQYLYMPGREPFEGDDGLAYFTHEGEDYAKIFATIGGAGSNSADELDDLENRHMLLFQATSVAESPTDPRRAHADLSFNDNWENKAVEASYISADAPAECDTANTDTPVRRIRKFVNVGYVRSEGLEEDDTGGGGDDTDEYGCTDSAALNYNPLATLDDGTCILCVDSITYGGSPPYFGGSNQFAPFHYLPYFFAGGAEVHGLGEYHLILGATDGGTTAAIPIDGVLSPTAEISIDTGSTASETYSWWDGNIANAFNTRGVDPATGLGALNSGNGGTANSDRTYFRMVQTVGVQTASIASNNAAGDAAGFDQYGGSTYSNYATWWEDMEQAEDASAMVLAVYNYSDWVTNLINANNIPDADQGNNGWAVDSYSGSLAHPKTNVYHDTAGDYSGIHLNGVTPVATFTNEGLSAFRFDFSTYNQLLGGYVADKGLKAGEQYVAVMRFMPKNTCVGEVHAYYWAYNFFVEYCTCTTPNNQNEGTANPTGLASYPYEGTNWEGHSTFPGVNAPNDGVNNLISAYPPGAGLIPSSFCTGFAPQFEGSDGGLSNGQLCLTADPDPDQEVDCNGFASWCLSDIASDCVQDPSSPPYGVYGELSFNVLIDGFFTQSESDTFQLYNWPNPQEQFVYEITVSLNGTLLETVVSHNIQTGEPNTVANGGPISIQETQATGYYGQIASVAFNGISWDDEDDDGVTDDLNLTVTLQYLGIINVETGVYTPGQYPDYVIGSPCALYSLTHEADFSECQDLFPGCLDPQATNFDENATIDDGSCIYIDCADIFSEQENSVFISAVNTTNDNLECEDIPIPETNPTEYISQYVAQGEGTMEIVVDDFSSAQLGAAGNEGNFTIAIMPIDFGGANQVPALLAAYEQQAGAFSGSEPVTHPNFVGETSIGAIFLPPDLDNPLNGSISGTVDGVSVTGQRYITEVPAFTLNTDDETDGGLFAGQYLIFLIPFIDFSLFEADGFGNLADCEEDFSYYADEQTYITIGNTVVDAVCNQPCDQFINPADCPNAVPGCTNPAADNYNELATFDDGSCELCVDCEFCDLNPAHPDCNLCNEGEEPVIAAGNRGFGARLRNCDGETEFCCCNETACNYDPACTDCDPTECEYLSCADDDTDDDEDDGTPVCPDPANPICDNSGSGTCIDTGDCECVTANCNEDCIFPENNCLVVDPPNDGPIDEFTTQTIICEPSISIPVTIDGVQTDNFVEAAVACTASDAGKMLMRMKTGSHYDETDLLKLSLISYLFNRGTEQQLDCLFDCNNYQSRVKRDGKVKGFGQRMVPVDCTQKWIAGGKKHFAASSNYSKGQVVRYVRMKSRKLVASYFIARRDWHPGDEIPETNRSKTSRIWEPCVNVKYQEGTNPENYMQTFIDFMVRHCQSCQVTTTVTTEEVKPRKLTNNTSIGFQDEFGNNIIF